MASRESSKPTHEDTVADLLRLGELLTMYATPISSLGLPCPQSPDEKEKIKKEIAQIEERLEARVYVRSERRLRAMLQIRGNETMGDPFLLRCIAYVAYCHMSGLKPRSIISSTSKAAGLGDWKDAISARREIRHAIIKANALVYTGEDIGKGGLGLGQDLVRFLSGENRLSLVWSEASIQAEKEDWEQKKKEKLFTKLSQSTEKKLSTPSVPTTTLATSSSCASPKAIYEALRQTVIGMDPVVKRFSVQMGMHMKRVAIMATGVKPTTPPVTTLLIGPSGCGKTHVAEQFGKLSGLAFAIGDMSSVTASAYIGSSVDELFQGFSKKGTTLEQVQSGIMFLDEVDKKRTNERGGDFDAVGVGVQFELLKILEGTRVQVGGKRSNDRTRGIIRTDGMAFILAGAFSDISDALARQTKTPLGFSGDDSSVGTSPDVRELLLNYFIPELINRIGSVIVIPPPSLQQLIQIATASMGIIARQNQFLSSFGLQIMPSPEAIQAIASWALETKTYSRGMRSLMQSLVEEAIFEEHKGELTIGAGEVRKAIEGLKKQARGLA